MRCTFQRPDRGGGTGGPVVKHQRKPASGPAHPQVETPAIRQPNVIQSHHAASQQRLPTSANITGRNLDREDDDVLPGGGDGVRDEDGGG